MPITITENLNTASSISGKNLITRYAIVKKPIISNIINLKYLSH